MAYLNFYYATMGSGKTMDLLRTAYNYEENDKKILVLKPLIDTKGGDRIVTRIGLERKVDFLINKDDNIANLLAGNIEDVSAIFVDEAQFLTPDQVKQLFEIAHAMGIDVICYGLRNNFKKEAFAGSAALLETADKFHELKTLCHCGNIARYVGRKLNGVYQIDGDVVVIDGTVDVEYVPLCGDCYLKEVMGLDFEEVKSKMKIKTRKE